MIVTETEAETQGEKEAGYMHWEPEVGFDPGSPGSRPGPKAGAKPLRLPGIPNSCLYTQYDIVSGLPHSDSTLGYNAWYCPQVPSTIPIP